jgi:hypothetical protein
MRSIESTYQVGLPWLTLLRPENRAQMGRTRTKTKTKRSAPTVKRKVMKPQNVSKRRRTKRKRQTLPKQAPLAGPLVWQ